MTGTLYFEPTSSTEPEWMASVWADDSVRTTEPPARNQSRILRVNELAADTLDRIIDRGRHESFENGYDSLLSRSIHEFITEYGALALRLIEKKVLAHDATETIVEEVLQSLGHLDQPRTQAGRRKLLERQLFNQPTVIGRDAALAGLALLSDPAALPALRRAAEKESSLRLQDDIRKVIRELSEGDDLGTAVQVAPK